MIYSATCPQCQKITVVQNGGVLTVAQSCEHFHRIYFSPPLREVDILLSLFQFQVIDHMVYEYGYRQ